MQIIDISYVLYTLYCKKIKLFPLNPEPFTMHSQIFSRYSVMQEMRIRIQFLNGSGCSIPQPSWIRILPSAAFYRKIFKIAFSLLYLFLKIVFICNKTDCSSWDKKQKIRKQNEIFVDVSADHFKISGSAFPRSTHMITDPDPDPATKVNTDPSGLPPLNYDLATRNRSSTAMRLHTHRAS
jgi:hypothetical protein